MGHEWHYGRSTDTYPSSIDITDFPIGTSSLNLNGNYLYTEHSTSQLMHNKEFTVDFYFKYIKQQSHYIPLLSLYGQTSDNGSNFSGSCITTREVNQLAWYCSSSNGTKDITNGDYFSFGSIRNNIWYHLAFVRDVNGFYGFIDGTKRFTKTIALSVAIRRWNNIICIGGNSFYDIPSYIKICNFRVSNIARWTTNFTPPT